MRVDGTVFYMKNNAIWWPTSTLRDYASKCFPTLTILHEHLIGKNNTTITCLIMTMMKSQILCTVPVASIVNGISYSTPKNL